MGKSSTVKPAFMEFIPKGRANAISLHDLCGKVGLESSEMKERIKDARIAGYTIASCNQGYFIPLTDGELIAYYTAHKKRALTALVSTEPIRKILIKRGYKVKGSKVMQPE